MRMFAILPFLGISMIPVYAQEVASPCVVGAENQADLNECSTQRYKAADALLNRTYRKVTAALNHTQTEKLKEAQRAWISFRDANCEAQAFDFSKGSQYTSKYTDCLTSVTEMRISEMERVYLQQEMETLTAERLVGTWRTSQESYGLEMRFGIEGGIHYFSSKIKGIPFEAGQWSLSEDQLSIINSQGKILHQYVRVDLNTDNVLSLYEADGGVEQFLKLE